MSLANFISDTWNRIQGELFPALADDVGPRTKGTGAEAEA